MEKDQTLTILELRTFCKNQIRKGNGNKKILISSDDEGNEYHNLYYAFTDDIDEIKAIQDYSYMGDITDNLENYVILG